MEQNTSNHTFQSSEASILGAGVGVAGNTGIVSATTSSSGTSRMNVLTSYNTSATNNILSSGNNVFEDMVAASNQQQQHQQQHSNSSPSASVSPSSRPPPLPAMQMSYPSSPLMQGNQHQQHRTVQGNNSNNQQPHQQQGINNTTTTTMLSPQENSRSFGSNPSVSLGSPANFNLGPSHLHQNQNQQNQQNQIINSSKLNNMLLSNPTSTTVSNNASFGGSANNLVNPNNNYHNTKNSGSNLVNNNSSHNSLTGTPQRSPQGTVNITRQNEQQQQALMKEFGLMSAGSFIIQQQQQQSNNNSGSNNNNNSNSRKRRGTTGSLGEGSGSDGEANAIMTMKNNNNNNHHNQKHSSGDDNDINFNRNSSSSKKNSRGRTIHSSTNNNNNNRSRKNDNKHDDEENLVDDDDDEKNIIHHNKKSCCCSNPLFSSCRSTSCFCAGKRAETTSFAASFSRWANCLMLIFIFSFIITGVIIVLSFRFTRRSAMATSCVATYNCSDLPDDDDLEAQQDLLVPNSIIEEFDAWLWGQCLALVASGRKQNDGTTVAVGSGLNFTLLTTDFFQVDSVSVNVSRSVSSQQYQLSLNRPSGTSTTSTSSPLSGTRTFPAAGKSVVMKDALSIDVVQEISISCSLQLSNMDRTMKTALDFFNKNNNQNQETISSFLSSLRDTRLQKAKDDYIRRIPESLVNPADASCLIDDDDEVKQEEQGLVDCENLLLSSLDRHLLWIIVLIALLLALAAALISYCIAGIQVAKNKKLFFATNRLVEEITASATIMSANWGTYKYDQVRPTKKDNNNNNNNNNKKKSASNSPSANSPSTSAFAGAYKGILEKVFGSTNKDNNNKSSKSSVPSKLTLDPSSQNNKNNNNKRSKERNHRHDDDDDDDEEMGQIHEDDENYDEEEEEEEFVDLSENEIIETMVGTIQGRGILIRKIRAKQNLETLLSFVPRAVRNQAMREICERDYEKQLNDDDDDDDFYNHGNDDDPILLSLPSSTSQQQQQRRGSNPPIMFSMAVNDSLAANNSMTGYPVLMSDMMMNNNNNNNYPSGSPHQGSIFSTGSPNGGALMNNNQNTNINNSGLLKTVLHGDSSLVMVSSPNQSPLMTQNHLVHHNSNHQFFSSSATPGNPLAGSPGGNNNNSFLAPTSSSTKNQHLLAADGSSSHSHHHNERRGSSVVGYARAASRLKRSATPFLTGGGGGGHSMNNNNLLLAGDPSSPTGGGGSPKTPPGAGGSATSSNQGQQLQQQQPNFASSSPNSNANFLSTANSSPKDLNHNASGFFSGVGSPYNSVQNNLNPQQQQHEFTHVRLAPGSIMRRRRCSGIFCQLHFDSSLQRNHLPAISELLDQFVFDVSNTAKQFNGVVVEWGFGQAFIQWNGFTPYGLHETQACLCALALASHFQHYEENPKFNQQQHNSRSSQRGSKNSSALNPNTMTVSSSSNQQQQRSQQQQQGSNNSTNNTAVSDSHSTANFSICVNSGIMTVGLCGTVGNLSPFCIGDAVNHMKYGAELGRMINCRVIALHDTIKTCNSRILTAPVDIVSFDNGVTKTVVHELRGDAFYDASISNNNTAAAGGAAAAQSLSSFSMSRGQNAEELAARPYFMKGFMYLSQSRYEEAFEHFQRAEEINPADYQITRLLGVCYSYGKLQVEKRWKQQQQQQQQQQQLQQNNNNNSNNNITTYNSGNLNGSVNEGDNSNNNSRKEPPITIDYLRLAPAWIFPEIDAENLAIQTTMMLNNLQQQDDQQEQEQQQQNNNNNNNYNDSTTSNVYFPFGVNSNSSAIHHSNVETQPYRDDHDDPPPASSGNGGKSPEITTNHHQQQRRHTSPAAPSSANRHQFDDDDDDNDEAQQNNNDTPSSSAAPATTGKKIIRKKIGGSDAQNNNNNNALIESTGSSTPMIQLLVTGDDDESEEINNHNHNNHQNNNLHQNNHRRNSNRNNNNNNTTTGTTNTEENMDDEEEDYEADLLERKKLAETRSNTMTPGSFNKNYYNNTSKSPTNLNISGNNLMRPNSKSSIHSSSSANNSGNNVAGDDEDEDIVVVMVDTPDPYASQNNNNNNNQQQPTATITYPLPTHTHHHTHHHTHTHQQHHHHANQSYSTLPPTPETTKEFTPSASQPAYLLSTTSSLSVPIHRPQSAATATNSVGINPYTLEKYQSLLCVCDCDVGRFVDREGRKWTGGNSIEGRCTNSFSIHTGVSATDGSLAELTVFHIPDDLIELKKKEKQENNNSNSTSSTPASAQQILEELIEEARQANSLRHRSIQSCLSIALTPDHKHFVLIKETCGGGTLADLLAKFGSLGITALRRFAQDIANALQVHHSNRNAPHGAVDCKNILLAVDGFCKLVLTGANTVFMTAVGGDEFIAPELLVENSTPNNQNNSNGSNNTNVSAASNPNSPSKKSSSSSSSSSQHPAASFAGDVWSYGIVLCYMYSGFSPYNDTLEAMENGLLDPTVSLRQRIAAKEVRPVNPVKAGADGPGAVAQFANSSISKIDFSSGDETEDMLRGLINQCLNVNPSRRCTVQQILSHPFFLI